jgi:sarcosine oxidase subunit beta
MHVAVVGGGIVGLSSAYYLARRGASVTLFERDSLGMQSTARSAGGIRAQFQTAVNVDLSVESKRVWNDFEEEFGVDIGYRKTGYLFLTRTASGAATFRDTVEMQQSRGAKSVYLDPADAVSHCPGLQPEVFEGATYNPDDGFADPNLAVQGYAGAARDAGVDIRTSTAVTDVLVDDGEVGGVETTGGRHETDYVVDAAGPGARAVAGMAGLDVPMYPRRRQIAVVEPTNPVPEDNPLTIDLERGSYFRPERDGDALVGGHFADDDPNADPEHYDDSMEYDWAATAVEHAGEYTTYFDRDTRIKRGWAGLYSVTPDNHPIIDELVPGFVVAGGFSGHGFQHAPATGRLVAELVHDGQADSVDISVLTADRFERGEPVVESNVV